MQYVRLTGTGLDVSKVCLGTMTFGDQLNEGDALECVNYALSEGVNFFDTANVYNEGKSEEILGKAMAGRRDKFIVATKVGSKRSNILNGSGLARGYILKQVEASLKRLRTDYIDLYYLHTPDNKTPIEETLETMDTLVRSGKVRYVGASNYAAWQLCQMYYKAKKAGYVPPVVTQMVYNLITRGIEQELVPFLKNYKMGLVVYNPIAAGFLTAKYKEKQMLPNTRFADNKMYQDRYWNQDNFAAWDKINQIAENSGLSMLELAMGWLHTTQNVDCIITGFSKLEQLKENLAALEPRKLAPETMASCEEVWQNLAGTRFKYNR